jgi:hypothetical protein
VKIHIRRQSVRNGSILSSSFVQIKRLTTNSCICMCDVKKWCNRKKIRYSCEYNKNRRRKSIAGFFLFSYSFIKDTCLRCHFDKVSFIILINHLTIKLTKTTENNLWKYTYIKGTIKVMKTLLSFFSMIFAKWWYSVFLI